MIVLVCGGRDFNDAERLSFWLHAVQVQNERKIIGLIHGSARGADTLAKEWQEAGIKLDRKLWCAGYPADWATHGKAAGPIRNQHMLDQNPGIELVVAFPGGSGTADMVRRAKAKGIKVVEVA